MKELLELKREALHDLSIIEAKIKAFDDGFDYKVITQVYHNTRYENFTNAIAAFDWANEFYGDNEFADLYTNNKNSSYLKENRLTLHGGNIYYCKNIVDAGNSEKCTEY